MAGEVARNGAAAREARESSMLLRPGVTCEKAIRFLDDLVQGGLNDVRNSVPKFAQPTLAGVEPSKLAGPDLVVALRQYAQWTATTARQLAGVFAGAAARRALQPHRAQPPDALPNRAAAALGVGRAGDVLH
ncbi:hypothetical protein ACFYRK_33705 [Streptomyces sp. NPDC005381]|uniref:hypothetical protein n=1 Tax=Streptomyces sp. NPDC005381 TaxID=3364714 RepID=UPI0036A346AF